MSDDDDFCCDVVYEPLPVKFQPAVLALAPLLLVKHAAKGVAKSAELLADAVNSHLEFERDMTDFQSAAAMEIETLTAGEE